MIFFISFILIIILTGAILFEMDKSSIYSQNDINKAHSMAIAIDCALNDGVEATFDGYFSIEQNKLHITNGSKIIEVGGVFESDKAQPV